MKELVFEILLDAVGEFVAEAILESTFIRADTWDELKVNVREALQAC